MAPVFHYLTKLLLKSSILLLHSIVSVIKSQYYGISVTVFSVVCNVT